MGKKGEDRTRATWTKNADIQNLLGFFFFFFFWKIGFSPHAYQCENRCTECMFLLDDIITLHDS